MLQERIVLYAGLVEMSLDNVFPWMNGRAKNMCYTLFSSKKRKKAPKRDRFDSLLPNKKETLSYTW